MIDLRLATPEDIHALDIISPNEEVDYYARCFEQDRLIVIAMIDGLSCGCAQLNFNPRYSLYKKLSYPEIQDVAVLPDYRRRGIAGDMIAYLENAARARGCTGVGISVGITRDFGPAQRLYIKLGYEPDGCGATYDRQMLDAARLYHPGDLVLMLVKEFSRP